MTADSGAVRNFKDFLQLYNKMTEMCFQRCVVNLNVRKLDEEEISCVNDCSQKFVSYNNKLMQNFIKFQEEITLRRVKEMEAQQKLMETEQNEKALEAQNLSVTA